MVNAYNHVVAQVVKAKFVVCAVSNIRGISSLSFREIKTMHNQADRKSEEVVNTSHISAVSLCQVFIDRNDVNAFTRQSIEIRRQRCHKRLAFARTHFGNFPTMEHAAACKLHIKMPQPGYTP